MASPFSIFRRHQRVSLAVLGVVVMIGFVVLPAIMQMQQYATSNANNPVVIRWKGGELTEAQLAAKRNKRSTLLGFIRELQDTARNNDPDVQLNTAIGIPATDDPRSIVQTLLLADKARAMGVVVSDQAIDDYLTSITEGVVKPDEIVDARRKKFGVKWTQEMLYDALREELLAQKVRQMASTAVAVTTPAAAWEYHNRKEGQVTAEFVPFNVDDYLKEVTAEPSDRELKALYEKYKGEYPMLNSPEPGFKERPKAEFQYFVAVYNDFLQEEKAKVTREQIQKHYDENKNTYRIDEEPEQTPADDDADDPRKAKPNPPVPTTSDSPAAETDAPAEQPAVESGAPGDAGEAGEPAADAPPADTPADEADVKLPPVNDKETAATDKPADDDLAAPPEKSPKYKPLAEVEEDIRRQLASVPAEKRLADAMNEAKNRLREYRDQVVLHETDRENSEHPGKFDYKAIAKQLGLSSGETGLIDALDLFQDKQLELGQSYQLSEDLRRNAPPQRVPFAAVAFNESVRLNYPIETQLGGREKVFLSWKVKEEKAHVPELKDIRDKVVAAWKLDEARKLAKAAAEKFAAEVDGTKPLQEQVSGDEKVLTPPPFAYYSPMSLLMFRLQGQQPEPEEIPGVEEAGYDSIKKKIFALPVGGVDVVENAGKSAYYVVRVAGEGNVEQQRKKFMQEVVDSPLDGAPPELRYLGYGDQVAVFQDWNDEIEKEFGVEWVDKEYLERVANDR